MNSEEILKKVNEILEQEGLLENNTTSPAEALDEFILPGLKNSKDILSTIYVFQTRNRTGILGKLKSIVQTKIVNTCINVIERQSMKQQKFNELTFRAIETLTAENKALREEVESLKKS
jgi:hypothetical protein